MTARQFCTYFDHNYMVRGLAMYRSLERHCPDFLLHVLCLDDTSYDALCRARLKHVRPLRLPDLEAYDGEFAATRGRRSLVEYYFTLTSVLPLFLFDSDPEIDAITYLDSDLYFFADPEPVFREMGAASILIIGHRFSPTGKFRERYGIYNVGWVTFRRDERAAACLEWYRTRCLEWCCDHVEEARYADQKYLDQWPARFRGVHVLQHKGCNLAPWNLENYVFSVRDGRFHVDDDPLVFYHFQALKSPYELVYEKTSIKDYQTAPLKSDVALVLDNVYRPYVEAMCAARDEVAKLEVDAPHAARELRHTDLPPLAVSAAGWRDHMGWTVIDDAAAAPWGASAFFPQSRRYAWRALSNRRPGPDLAMGTTCAGLALAHEAVMTAAALAAGDSDPLNILDWGGASERLPAYAAAVRALGPRRGSYTAVSGTLAQDIRDAFPTVTIIDNPEAGLHGKPQIIVATGVLGETRDWFWVLSLLAATGAVIVLGNLHTLSGTPTLLTQRRPTGSLSAAAMWIFNRRELQGVLDRLGFVVAREVIWPDPLRVPGIPELADKRTLVLQSKPL